MLTERELQISPIVQESVMHNTKVRPVAEFTLPTPSFRIPCSCHVALPCSHVVGLPPLLPHFTHRRRPHLTIHSQPHTQPSYSSSFLTHLPIHPSVLSVFFGLYFVTDTFFSHYRHSPPSTTLPHPCLASVPAFWV